MQFRTIWMRFEALECKFQPFERDSNHRMVRICIWTRFEPFECKFLPSKGILTIPMPIRTVWTRFEALECKVEPFEWHSKQQNANSNHSKRILTCRMPIWTIPMEFEQFECKFEQLKRDLNYLKATFERNSNHSNANSNHSKEILANHSNEVRSSRMQTWTIRTTFKALECKFEPFERDSNHSNANSNRSNDIQTIWMQILTIQKGF